MKRHSNIAVFIPHLGCHNSCIFCSQTRITGVLRTEPDINDELFRVNDAIERGLSTLKSGEAEIAFFGGSFTGIGEDRMIRLLECASSHIGGFVKGIRCSTRPDYVNQHICDILKSHGVTAVELGIQSTDNRVLEAARRGHDADTAKRACAIIKKNGFELGGQMMVGLPLSTSDSEIKTAEDIVSCGADTCRIYPLVVFENTPLYDMVKSGEYIPLTTEEAVTRAAACARVFIKHKVEILRIGLHSSENLACAPYGANHPAIGELAEGEIYFGLIKELLDGVNPEKNGITVRIPKGELSKCIGQKGINRSRLEQLYKIKIRFSEEDGIEKYNVNIYV
ncbi:MAG: radical SAM protein [Eubacteriales bacterium]|nr:radical SAM protein [Eubacteriales bacterium]